MILNVNAINLNGTASAHEGNLVRLGETTLRDGKLSEELEFTGTPPFRLMIVDGTGGRGKGVVWLEDKVCLVNAGDSGTYLFRDGIVERLDADEEGEDAVTDISGKLQEGDILLIFSDSLGEVVNDDYLEYFLMSSPTPAEDLAEWAVENGSTDNIGVIAARIGGGEFGDTDGIPDDDGRFDAWA